MKNGNGNGHYNPCRVKLRLSRAPVRELAREWPKRWREPAPRSPSITLEPRTRQAKIVDEIKAEGGKAIALQADVSSEEQVKKMFDDLFREYGTIDILVANAGLQRDSALVDMTLAQWQFVLNVNLTGQFLCAREAAREFIRRGIDPERSIAAGKIICMSSVHEVIPWAGHCNYAWRIRD